MGFVVMGSVFFSKNGLFICYILVCSGYLIFDGGEERLGKVRFGIY